MEMLEPELDTLDRRFPDGYSLRLHVLGDFYSKEYVLFWYRQLLKRPRLNIFGYTHRDPISDPIGSMIECIWFLFGARFNILQSSGILGRSGRPVALLETDKDAEKLPVCPEQTGQATGCLDCGLCTLPYVKGVTFHIH